MPVLEGKWDCAQCRTIGISGLTTICPTCGDPRNEHLDPDEAPYLPDDARVLSDQKELDYAASGPSWNCGKCGTSNRGDSKACSNCGMPLDHDDRVSATHRYVSGVDAAGVSLSDPDAIETDWVDATLQSSDPLQPLEEGPVVTKSRTFALADLPRRGKLAVRDTARKLQTASGVPVRFVPIALIALLCFALVGVIGYVVYANYVKTNDISLTVRALSWERQVEVEEYRTLTQDDWSYPGDARVISSRRAIHHYNHVIDHYENRTRQVPETRQSGSRSESYACGSTTVNNGNGTFSSKTTYCTRQVPTYTTYYRTENYREPIYRDVAVFRTKYTYQVDRWVTDHFERARGMTNPHWPDTSSLSKKQRVGDERSSTYSVNLADEQNRSFKRQVKFNTWMALHVGEQVPAKQTHSGAVRSITWPSR